MSQKASHGADGSAREFTAFRRGQKLGSGIGPVLWPMLELAKREGDPDPILVFDDRTGESVEWDSGESTDRSIRAPGDAPTSGVRGDLEVPLPGTGVEAARRPGRPRLGVVAREVTLLPRHWEWLANQPGGASVALRKLVERARKSSSREDERRASREATYRFLAVAGGNEPGFEEVIRALFAGSKDRFETELSRWPADLRTYASRLAGDAFDDAGETESSQKGSG